MEKPHAAYILIDGVELENARNDDIRHIENYLEGIIGRNGCQLQASATDGGHFKRYLANLLLQNLKYHEGLQGSSPFSMPGMQSEV